MAETDNNGNSGSRRVNIKIGGGVPSFYQVSCLLVLQILSLRRIKKNIDKMGKLFSAIIITFGAF